MKNDRDNPVTPGPSPSSESRRGLLLRRARSALLSLRAARAALHAKTTATRKEILTEALRGAWDALWGAKAPPPPPETAGASRVDVTLDVNGAQRTISIEPRVSLLDALREEMGLTGTKKGCDHGQCGACTVLSDGRAINACMTLAIMQQGARITTIEGLARGGELSPVQAAFIEHDAFQCGYCTPGQILSATALLARGEHRRPHDIREHMSGNLCRCGAYDGIVAAVRAAQSQAESADDAPSEEG